jgi:acid phosphatase family membrane protein YuiD
MLSNRPLLSAVIAMMIAQFAKPFIMLATDRKFNWRLFFTTGGMPSSHTAAVVALTTSIYITEGIHSLAFSISFVFAAIVMHDAMSIRRAAGKQAEVINEWSRILADLHEGGEFSPENLKTMLGHNGIQVIAGTLLGLGIAYIFTVLIH